MAIAAKQITVLHRHEIVDAAVHGDIVKARAAVATALEREKEDALIQAILHRNAEMIDLLVENGAWISAQRLRDKSRLACPLHCQASMTVSEIRSELTPARRFKSLGPASRK